MIRRVIIAAILAAVTARADMEWQTAVGQKDQVTRGLVAYWAMRNSGTTVYDEWTGGINGTASGSPTFGEAYAAVGYGASFDGTDDYIDTGSAALGFTSNTTITLSMWIYPLGQTSGQNGNLLNDYNRTDAIGWITSFQADNKFGAIMLNGGSNSRQRYSKALATNTWHHCVAIIYHDGTLPDVYVNGALDNDSNVSAGTMTALQMGSGNVFIGAESVFATRTRYLRGYADEVRAYNRALTADEVKQLYRMGAIPKGIK